MACFVIIQDGDNDTPCVRALLCHILRSDAAAYLRGSQRRALGDFLRTRKDGAILSVADTR